MFREDDFFLFFNYHILIWNIEWYENKNGEKGYSLENCMISSLLLVMRVYLIYKSSPCFAINEMEYVGKKWVALLNERVIKPVNRDKFKYHACIPPFSTRWNAARAKLRNFSIFFLKPARPSRPVDRCSLRD